MKQLYYCKNKIKEQLLFNCELADFAANVHVSHLTVHHEDAELFELGENSES